MAKSLADIFLGPSAASGQAGRSPDLSVSNFDATTGQPLANALTGFEPEMMETTAFDPSRSTASDPFGFGIENKAPGGGVVPDGIKKTDTFQLTQGQLAGMHAASTGLKAAAAFENISEQEKQAMNKINEQYKNTEFAERFNSTMSKVSEARRLLASIDNLNRQARPQTATSQSQQFFVSPSSGMRLA
jgi:hypothetical protein